MPDPVSPSSSPVPVAEALPSQSGPYSHENCDPAPAAPVAPDSLAALEGLRGYEWVTKAVELVLREAKATKQTPLPGPDVFQRVSKLGISIPVSENTFSSYLSYMVKELESPVASTGRGRGGGYFLSDPTEALALQTTSKDEPVKSDWGKEKWLYPSLVSWMIGQGIQAKDTSAVRSLGKWGNPDVTGFAIDEHLSRIEITVTTIEAKLGFDAWEIDFFQAVSQRRFANRAYFAFALPEDAAEKLPADLRYYSERFGVGVLVIDLTNEVFQRLTSGSLNDEDKKLLQSDNGSLVREALSAPWQHVPMKYHRRLCEAFGIREIGDLMRWGFDRE